MFELQKVRTERWLAEINYHSAYNYLSLRGVLAERWAHGPYFGAYREAGNQITLTPSDGDKRAQGVYGLKASAFLAEGTQWVSQAPEVARAWFEDVIQALAPKRIVGVTHELMVLHPISKPSAVSRNIRKQFLADSQVAATVPSRFSGNFHAGFQMLADASDVPLSTIVGVLGPPHRSDFFAFPSAERGDNWFLGVRLTSRIVKDEGLEDSLAVLDRVIKTLADDAQAIVRTVFPGAIA